jgi:hypothetical protein
LKKGNGSSGRVCGKRPIFADASDV